MLENKELLTALVKNINTLREKLNKQNIEISETSHLDIYYTDGSASGSLFKLIPFGFYYNSNGKPHFGCWGDDYNMYGSICEEWIAAIRDTNSTS